MEKVIDHYPTMEWDERENQEDFPLQKERESDVDNTLTERSENDITTLSERSVNDAPTFAERSMNALRSLGLRVAQTANATKARFQAIKKANETPKANIYANVAEWLNDDRNVIDATNGCYMRVEELTDNPPQRVCDVLNKLMPPKDKTAWTPQNLMPVVFSVKYERLKKKYFSPTQYYLSLMGAFTILMFSWGWIGPNEKAKPKAINVKEYVAKWEKKNNFKFFPYRKDIIFKQPDLNSSNIELFLIRQREIQDSVIKSQKTK